MAHGKREEGLTGALRDGFKLAMYLPFVLPGVRLVARPLAQGALTGLMAASGALRGFGVEPAKALTAVQELPRELQKAAEPVSVDPFAAGTDECGPFEECTADAL
jgi:hypothetical protein